MKFFIPLLFTIPLLATPSGIYFELKGGVGLEDMRQTQKSNYIYERGYLGSLAIGYQANNFRFEVESRYKEDSLFSTYLNDLEDISIGGKLISKSQMLNLYYSGYNKSKITTTIGGGVGITTISTKNLLKFDIAQKDLQNKNIFSYQGIFSIGYLLNESITLSTQYRYFTTLKSDNFRGQVMNIYGLSIFKPLGFKV